MACQDSNGVHMQGLNPHFAPYFGAQDSALSDYIQIAVEGCCHGELDRTYAELKNFEHQTNQKADVLIICGDFQAIRNQSDLLCMAVPQKYRQLGQFHEYYTGNKTAPVLTILVGGNHEASNYMWELYHGGWLAPNIYYLGGSGCVRLNGIRIAGASGIFKGHDYNLGHYERVPYDNASLRSVYHVRSHDVVKLSLLTPEPEIFISHDWPEGIYRHGDTAALINQKPFFKPDIERGELGNPHMMDVLKLLRPSWWFSAHLHVRFQAEYDHTGRGISDWGRMKLGGSKAPASAKKANVKNSDEIVMDDDDDDDELDSTVIMPKSRPKLAPNADEIIMDDDADDETPTSKGEALTTKPPSKAAEEAVGMSPDQSLIGAKSPLGEPPLDPDLLPTKEKAALDNLGTSEGPLLSTTKFLALDKCVPRRKFLEIVDIPSPKSHSPPRLAYDTEWLAISKAMHPLLSTDKRTNIQPRLTLAQRWVERELEWIKEKIATIKRTAGMKGDMVEEAETEEDDGELEVEKVQQFVMTASGPNRNINPRQHPSWYTNPQTEAFCALIEVENKVNPVPKDFQGPGVGSHSSKGAGPAPGL